MFKQVYNTFMNATLCPRVEQGAVSAVKLTTFVFPGRQKLSQIKMRLILMC